MNKIEDTIQTRQQVVIVGGGIAGLFCARELASKDRNVAVLELRPELGGRIETGDLRGFVQDKTPTRPSFKAEFGPMRFELDIQPHFRQLCQKLGVEFEPFSAPGGPRWPTTYPLGPDECERDGKTPLRPLELLKLGVYRMFGKRTQVVPGTDGDEVVLVPGSADADWLKRLRDDAPPGNPHGFEYLRSQQQLGGGYLWNTGFRNALEREGVLSPMAVTKIMTEGTFYHLLPENPNAIEWAVFWLRLFKLGKGSLSQIPAGVRTVTERLQAELETKWKTRVRLHVNIQVVSVRAAHDKESVDVECIDLSCNPPKRYVLTADHAILALPRAPLKALDSTFPADVRGALDDVFGFTLLKVFLCGRAPSWWPPLGTPKPHDRAWLMSTREAHYFRQEGTDNAMILLYMDDPAAKTWSHLVRSPRHHDRAEYGGNLELKSQLLAKVNQEQREVASALIPKPENPRESLVDATDSAARFQLELIDRLEGVEEVISQLPPGLQLTGFAQLSQAAKALLRSPDDVAMKFADVSDYAIRDWSRMPFGAASHAWSIGARSWEVRRRLRAFALENAKAESAHICGEAYSDYQGFIEGALRSARDAVATIVGEKPPHSAT